MFIKLLFFDIPIHRSILVFTFYGSVNAKKIAKRYCFHRLCSNIVKSATKSQHDPAKHTNCSHLSKIQNRQMFTTSCKSKTKIIRTNIDVLSLYYWYGISQQYEFQRLGIVSQRGHSISTRFLDVLFLWICLHSDVYFTSVIVHSKLD